MPGFLIKWFDQTLIPEWRSAMKFLSMQWATFVAAVGAMLEVALQAMQLMDMNQQREMLTGLLGPYGPTAMAVIGFVGMYVRVKAQKNLVRPVDQV